MSSGWLPTVVVILIDSPDIPNMGIPRIDCPSSPTEMPIPSVLPSSPDPEDYELDLEIRLTRPDGVVVYERWRWVSR